MEIFGLVLMPVFSYVWVDIVASSILISVFWRFMNAFGGMKEKDCGWVGHQNGNED